MMKRLAALLIALVVAGSPIALEACQISCAFVQASDARSTRHAADSAQPACHETGTPASTLSRGSAPCDHGDAAISSSVVTTRPDTAASASVHVLVFPLGNTVRARFTDRGDGVRAVNRLELRLCSPLRI
jgi:hypothetical protein